MSRGTESKRITTGIEDGAGQGVADPPLSPGLWLVATPIGNLGDITLRAIRVLRDADILVCEDTRRTRQLMDLLDIPLAGRKMISYHDRNGSERRPQVIDALSEGLSVAYASDAGTPLIADPGYRLVTGAQESGHSVFTIPGPSSVIAALTVAGLPTDRFLFAGFLPPKSTARRKSVSELAEIPATLVFLESPRRLAAMLSDLSEVLGPDRPAAITRELTKTFEETRRGTLADLAAEIAETAVKGEIVVVVGPPDKDAQASVSDEDLESALRSALSQLSVKDAAREVAADLNLPRRDVYARAVELKNNGD